MDYKRIIDIKKQSFNLMLRLNMLEELHKETIEKINKTQNICNHEFIFINRKYENKAYDYLQCGKCLICGRGITLNHKNFDLDEKIFVPSEKIIDVSGEIEIFDVVCDCSESKSEFDEAQKVFDNLIEREPLRFKETVKYEITLAIKKMREIKKKIK